MTDIFFSIELIDKRIRFNTEETAAILCKVRDDESSSIYSEINELTSKLRKVGRTCWSSMFNDIYLLTDEYCAGCNNHNKIRAEKKKNFPLKKPVFYPVSMPSEKIRDIMTGINEMLIICENDPNETINKLFRNGADIIVIPEDCEYASDLLNVGSADTTQYCMGYGEFFELSRMNCRYYLSGIIVFYIGNDPKLAEKVLNVTSGKEYYRVFLVNSDIYVSGRNKNISELVNGARKYDYIIKRELI